jgi:membrane protease YdiL (CAAX protease family)
MMTGMVMMLNAPQIVQYVMPIICAWAPTFAVLLLFKKLMPDLTLREFLKQQFPPLKASVVIAVLIAQCLAWLAIVSSYSIIHKVALSSMLVTSLPAIIVGFFDQVVRGSTGEELGWRGYALNQLQKSYSPLSSALIIGVVWGFWHLPLWLVTSGYSGLELIQYMGLFMVGIVATSVVITAFYNLNKNLLIPILIHQLFNFGASMMNFGALQQLLYIDAV